MLPSLEAEEEWQLTLEQELGDILNVAHCLTLIACPICKCFITLLMSLPFVSYYTTAYITFDTGVA